MIDFTTCPVNKFKGYGGANGNKEMSYSNSCISEYLACHIFAAAPFAFISVNSYIETAFHEIKKGVIHRLTDGTVSVIVTV